MHLLHLELWQSENFQKHKYFPALQINQQYFQGKDHNLASTGDHSVEKTPKYFCKKQINVSCHWQTGVHHTAPGLVLIYIT